MRRYDVLVRRAPAVVFDESFYPVLEPNPTIPAKRRHFMTNEHVSPAISACMMVPPCAVLLRFTSSPRQALSQRQRDRQLKSDVHSHHR